MSQKDTSTVITQVSMAQGPSLQPTPTPVVNSATVAAIETAKAVSASLPAAYNVSGTSKVAAQNPDHYEVVVRAPAAHGMLAYLVGPGAEVVLKDIDLSKVQMADEAGNLRITLPNGAEILLLDFMASAHSKQGVMVLTDQGEIHANQLLASLDHELESKLEKIQPAEGIQNTGESGRGGFEVPHVNGVHFGDANPVLSEVIGPFGLGHVRDSIFQHVYPTGQGPNGAPVVPHTDLFANPDTFHTPENTPITFDSKVNDSNPEGTPFSVTSFTQPGHGTLVLNADNTFTFDPDHNFSGTVTFQYTITDGEGDVRTATDTIVVDHVNQGLFAVNDAYHTPENTPITFDSKVNDSNPDGTPFSVTSFNQPGHGNLTLNADNTFTFTPDHNFVGTVTFNYTITDAEGETRTATDTITVDHVNQGLFAVNDSYTTPENTPITFDSKVNDSNPDGTPFTVTSFNVDAANAAKGTLTLGADNQFTFVPAHNFVGDVTFTYTITDGEGETRTATDTIHVVHVNLGLDAENDNYHTPENTPITFDSKVNDSNPDGTAFSVTGFTQPGHGTLVLNADNTFTFTPDHNFFGTVTFNYTITDAEGEVRTATDTIVVDHVNQGLFAVNDAYTTNENTAITFDSKVNDSNPDGTAFSVTSFTQPGNGTLVLNANNTFTFTPAHNFAGDVSFQYTITDAEGETRTATDTIHVVHVNQGLNAVNDSYHTPENTPITFDSKVNDSNPDGTAFSVTSFTQPGHGTLVLNADNTFTFNPDHNFSGTVTFNYTITDAEGEVRTATDTIVVDHVNQGLNAVNDSYHTPENTPITFDSKVNDSNPDGTPFSVTSFTQPGHGTLVLNADNTFTFTPDHNFSGSVQFNYTITDAEGEVRTATDTIVVDHVNQGLFAVNDAYTTLENTPINFDSKVNDSNPDGTAFSVTSFTQPGHGTLVLNADNTFTFVPTHNFSGDVSFQYTITDAEGETRTATDTIHVVHVNQGLDAENDNYTTNYQTAITFDSKVNDSNPDGTPFSVTGFTQPGHGTLSLNADNTFTFTPANGFSGDVSFTYTITDAEGETRSAVDTIHVNAPVVVPPPPPPPVCPLTIDLGGDGITITHNGSGSGFDLTGDGTTTHTAWVGAGEGILVHDVGADGSVTINQVFGNSSVDGFTEMAQLEDTNHDGVVNAHDAAWNTIQVWTDTNGDGKAEAGELHTLADLGITSISLSGEHADGQNFGDALITNSSTVTYADGHTTDVSDVYYTLNSKVDTSAVLGQQSEIVADHTDVVATPAAPAPEAAAPAAASSGADLLNHIDHPVTHA